MRDDKYIELVVCALEKVPATSLLIIELVNRFTRNGQLDYDALTDAQDEVEMAIKEAKIYGSHTIRAIDILDRLEAKPADVGFGNTAPSE